MAFPGCRATATSTPVKSQNNPSAVTSCGRTSSRDSSRLVSCWASPPACPRERRGNREDRVRRLGRMPRQGGHYVHGPRNLAQEERGDPQHDLAQPALLGFSPKADRDETAHPEAQWQECKPTFTKDLNVDACENRDLLSQGVCEVAGNSYPGAGLRLATCGRISDLQCSSRPAW